MQAEDGKHSITAVSSFAQCAINIVLICKYIELYALSSFENIDRIRWLFFRSTSEFCAVI